MMKTYRILWEVLSPLGTELQSDTIFGHLCWAMYYTEGDDILSEFLDQMTRKPMLLLSSGFPTGFIPFPQIKLTSMSKEVLRAQMNMNGRDLIFATFLKELKKTRWISTKLWGEINDDFSPVRAYLHAWENFPNLCNFFDNQNDLKSQPTVMTRCLITHSAIDRITGTAGKGLLYDEPTTFYEEGTSFTSFLQTDYFTIEKLKSYFNYIETVGFGRNKSTGMGRFRINISLDEPKGVRNTNAWLNLSNCVPAPNDTTSVYYEGFTKYGKTGGNYALDASPFKHPLFMLKPGSVFLSSKKPTGIMVSGIHHGRPEIMQNGYAYSIPFKLSEDINARNI